MFPQPFKFISQIPYPLCFSNPPVTYKQKDSIQVNILWNFQQQTQTQYSKNLDFLKSKYKKSINPIMQFLNCDILFNTFQGFPRIIGNDFSVEKIYYFLSVLAYYEIRTQRFRTHFDISDWNKLSELMRSKLEDVYLIKEEIFKKNTVNYKWTNQEDLLLEKIILKHQTENNSKIPWQNVTNEFNQYLCLSQIRTSSHCQERWKNTLKKKFKRGKWTTEEDLLIISAVLKYGPKWSKLTHLCLERTEHDIKNRFFSIISNHLSMPIRKTKKSINCFNIRLLEEVIKENQSKLIPKPNKIPK